MVHFPVCPHPQDISALETVDPSPLLDRVRKDQWLKIAGFVICNQIFANFIGNQIKRVEQKGCQSYSPENTKHNSQFLEVTELEKETIKSERNTILDKKHHE